MIPYRIVLATVLALPTGCTTLEAIDRAAYDTSKQVAPTHPVTGLPALNVIDEKQEVAFAQRAWSELAAAATVEGATVDPPGGRLIRIKHVFGLLTAVAHRQSLPWEVHLIDVPKVNAFTPGGGMVVVLDGLSGGLIPPDDDEALAAVLAHEIAHVTMLHVPQGATWTTLGPLLTDRTDDPYYAAAYTTEQEAEADRLSVLYLALAGFDPMAAPRVWAGAHQQYGSSAAASGFLHDHPLNAERMAATADAARQVMQYRVPGAQNPSWEEILANNTLFPRAPEVEYKPGAGLLRAAAATLEAYGKHEAAKEEQHERQRAARDFGGVQIVRAFEAATATGHAGLFLDVYNGGGRTVSGLAVAVHYVRGQQLLGTDPSCQAQVTIPPGQLARIGCYRLSVAGSDRAVPQIADVMWR